MLKKMNKTTKNNLITYAMVILAFVIMQISVSYTHLTLPTIA